MSAVLWKTLGTAGLALAFVAAPGMEAPAHKSHKSILKVEFAERRELDVLIDNFVLTDQDGRRVEFRQTGGSAAICPVVINFMYTSCPDVCWPGVAGFAHGWRASRSSAPTPTTCG